MRGQNIWVVTENCSLLIKYLSQYCHCGVGLTNCCVIKDDIIALNSACGLWHPSMQYPNILYYTAIWSLYRHVVCNVTVSCKANVDRNQLWAQLVSVLLLWIFYVFMFLFCLVFAMSISASVYMCFVVT